MKTLLAGLALTALVAMIEWLAWGAGVLAGAVAFGLLATAIQVTAVLALRPALAAPFPILMKRWAVGMGLRLAGVILIPVAVLARPELFPPLPVALGYLSVVVPLLFLETRLAQ